MKPPSELVLTSSPKTPPRALRAVALLLGAWLLLAATACYRAAPAPWVHDAYIWQRQWTEPVREAVAQSSSLVRRWRVLAAELNAQGVWQPVRLDVAALQRSGVGVVLVFRMDGQLADGLGAARGGARLQGEIVDQLQRWDAAGLRIAGVEIDHDCATARLPAYAEFLRGLRARLNEAAWAQEWASDGASDGAGASAMAGAGASGPAQGLPRTLELSITALPTWTSSPDLLPVLHAVDEAVLQLHAVSQPRDGLFDGPQARAWVAAFARITPVPFRIALPTYGSRLGFDERGNLASVESETPQLQQWVDARELLVTPQALGAWLADLRMSAPPLQLRGVVWFRLPVAGDARNWSLRTWHAVLRGADLTPQLVVSGRATEVASTYEVVLSNRGWVDAALPERVQAPSFCSVGDGAAGYGVRRVALGTDVVDVAGVAKTPDGSAAVLQWQRAQPGLLHAGHARVLGWVRCAQPPLPSDSLDFRRFDVH